MSAFGDGEQSQDCPALSMQPQGRRPMADPNPFPKMRLFTLRRKAKR